MQREQLLSAQRQRIVRYMLLHKTPADYGIDSYQWTADRMRAVIEQKWHVTVSQRSPVSTVRPMGPVVTKSAPRLWPCQCPRTG